MASRTPIDHVLVGLAALVLMASAACGAAPPTPTPAPAPTPAAADGVDVAACQDGVCEVRVDGPVTIPLDPRYGVGNLRVTAVKADVVTITGEILRAGSVRSDCTEGSGSCASDAGSMSITNSTSTSPSVFELTAPAGYSTLLPAVRITAVAVEADSAILRLAHPEATDGADLAACRDGTCAVRLDGPASIPLDPRFGMRGDIRVLSITADAVGLSVTPAGEDDITVACGATGSLKVCPTTFERGVVASTLLLGGELRFPDLTIQVSAIDAGSAVLRLEPAR